MASIFYRFWWILVAKLGRNIDQKSIQKGVEKVMKKEGHQNGKKGAVRPRDAIRHQVSRAPGRSTPLSRAKPFGPEPHGNTRPSFQAFHAFHATPRHASPRHASPRLATPRHDASPGQVRPIWVDFASQLGLQNPPKSRKNRF